MTNDARESPRRQQLVSLLRSPRLPVTVAVLGVLLASPALFSGFHLDDHVHRYLLGTYPGAEELARAYVSPFAIADGDPAHNRWLVEEGYAPWWMHEELRLTFFRPLAELTHRVDHALFPGSALLQHAHSLLWFGAVLLAGAAAFR
ncbi:MAG: hypothetical protein FJ104_16205, partial [Deltaproteobacteria bacterium]|nr:hypothetical protein [Deltaproteobacteria bacterium]